MTNNNRRDVKDMILSLSLTEYELYTLKEVLDHAGGAPANFEVNAAFDLFERISNKVNRLEDLTREAYSTQNNG